MSSRCPARPLTAVIVTLVCCSGVIAQEFPSRPLRLMVPVGPGSGVDVIARALAPALSADLGRPVLVENRPGASGNIAAVATLKEKADGHTVLLGIDAIFTTNGHLFPKLDYDPWKDFTLVAPIAETSIFLAAHEKTGATSLAGLLALVRSQPGRYNYSAPVASPYHFAGERLAQLAGLQWQLVSYKDVQQMIAELGSGQVPFGFAPLPALRTFVTRGNLRLLAIASAQRSETQAQVATIAETFPGFAESAWYCMVVASPTPDAVVSRLAAAAVRARDANDLKPKLEAGGMRVIAADRSEFEARMRAEYRQRGELIRTRGITVQ